MVQLRASRCWRSQAPKYADMIRFQDQSGAVRVGGLANGDPAAGELLGFQAVTAVVAPGFAPAIGAEAGGGHTVAYVLDLHVRSP